MSEAVNASGILLEAGTNELEVLVFSVGPTRYGVNVAKIREIIGQVKVVHVPITHPAIVGVFKLRESVIPLVDLQLFFEPEVGSEATQRTVILTEFNDVQMGFLVDTVERIFRLNWSEVRPMPTAQEASETVVTSVCEVEGGLVLMLDFERIVFEIQGRADVFKVADDVSGSIPSDRGAQHILLAEDSPTIRKAIESNLIQAGFVQVTSTSDGAEAWSTLEASLAGKDSAPFTIVVTDIEMPSMDGLHLCKRVKEHRQLRDLPVVVFSSLVSDSNLQKCKAVGADAAITKPQMVRLVGLLDELLAPSDSGTGHGKAEMLLAVD